MNKQGLVAKGGIIDLSKYGANNSNLIFKYITKVELTIIEGPELPENACSVPDLQRLADKLINLTNCDI